MRTVLLLALVAVLAGCVPEPPATPPPAPPATPAPVSVPTGDLTVLTVGPDHPMTGYTREKFKHWVEQSPGCDTRDVVIARQGDTGPSPSCSRPAGPWTSVYDGVVVVDRRSLDVDHVVPLAEAWRSGADTWTPARRQEFANDLRPGFLVAVTAKSNRSKGDQDPAKWLPPALAYRCAYVRAWVAVKVAYALTVDEAERAALVRESAACG